MEGAAAPGEPLHDLLYRVFRVERGEGAKLLAFGLFGFLLQMGMGVGFSAGDAAFLSNAGADRLPVVYLLTPVVMLVYTGLFSYLLVRFSIDHMVDITLAMLVAGGAILWALLGATLDPAAELAVYFALKLYLAMWYIALYSLFWNFTDAYFDIQDAKRLFPLFAAFCALGTATGALAVGLFADALPMRGFMLLWAGIALLTAPLAQFLRRRWIQIAETDAELGATGGKALGELAAVGSALRRSRYTLVLALVLFVMLLLTNLAEFQYSTVLQEGRSEADLAELFGGLYAAANLFNLVVCLFVFNRLVARFGVRNVAFIQPLTYFAVFGYFFVEGGEVAAIAAFFAYHGVLTSIEYNNQNLLFNAVPSQVKRPLRTIVEGLCEPLASLFAGGFLLLAADYLDIRELSGIGVIVGLLLIGAVVLLRQLYVAAMASNMRRGWLDFAEAAAALDPAIGSALETQAAHAGTPAADFARALLAAGGPAQRPSAAVPQDIDAPELAARLGGMDRAERQAALALLGRIGDSQSIPDMLAATRRLAPRDCRAMASLLAGLGETAIPRLIGALRDPAQSYRLRSVAARALAELSYAQFSAQLDRLVHQELREAGHLLAGADGLAAAAKSCPALALLVRAQRERVAASIDFVLELLALAGQLPDFDLLIVSLHSANAKVRGNAVEAIESGVAHATFRLLGPLLRPVEANAAGVPDEGVIIEALDRALRSGREVEQLAAAEALRRRVDHCDFTRRISDVARPGMPRLLRDHLAACAGLGDGEGVRCFDALCALAAYPGLGGATLEALVALAAQALAQRPDEAALGCTGAGGGFWILHADLREVAGRFPDLALVMFKARDDLRHAA